MPEFCRGRIVWVELLDPQDRNRKRRPAVIITAAFEIGTDEVWVVALSSRIDTSLAEMQVEIPWHRAGHPRTGLKERCVAVCNWLEKIRIDDVQDTAGVVPGKQMLEILTRIKPPDQV